MLQPEEEVPTSTEGRTLVVRETASCRGLMGAARMIDIFVGGCSSGTTSEQVAQYCKYGDIELKTCESLESKSKYYESFKITAVFTDKDKLLNPEFWPMGVFVRKFFKPKQLNM